MGQIYGPPRAKHLRSSVHSPVFSCGGLQGLKLVLYPNGRSDSSPGQVFARISPAPCLPFLRSVGPSLLRSLAPSLAPSLTHSLPPVRLTFSTLSKRNATPHTHRHTQVGLFLDAAEGMHDEVAQQVKSIHGFLRLTVEGFSRTLRSLCHGLRV